MSQKPGGVGIYTCDGVSVEIATKKCGHCQHMVDIPKPREIHSYMDFCRNCFVMICIECSGKPCVPLLKRIEDAEAKAYRSEQFRKSMGF